jgi:phosphoribosylcarboxyaminoimidazole (NCAIR) mutase
MRLMDGQNRESGYNFIVEEVSITYPLIGMVAALSSLPVIRFGIEGI